MALALEKGDTVGRVLGPGCVVKPWERSGAGAATEGAGAPRPEAGRGAEKAEAEAREHPAEAAGERRFLPAPEGQPDDLKKISGIGPKIERLLNEVGIYHYRQIATLTGEDIAWLDERLKFRGRIERDDWVGQAKKLAGEG